ncbi:hypothetical protein LIP_2392 [Limnochorda pilosa]|uniref:Uncharacterized protein n=1 Tax=Limnochorda pilosa TaxID=1555112 RepID=A0A0K2SM89_LIMPI|nr:hypothetical protein LIP_2392 [Limnochorda pilosa]
MKAAVGAEVARDHPVLPDGETSGLHGQPKALQAVLPRKVVAGPRNVGNPPVAQPDQMLRGLDRSRHILDHDGGGGQEAASRDHDRHPIALQRRHACGQLRVVSDTGAGEDEAVDPLFPQDADVAQLRRWLSVAVSQDDCVPGGPGRFLDTLREVVEVRVGDVGDHQPNGVRGAGYQAPRQPVRIIVQFTRRLDHPLACGGAYGTLAV